MEKFCLSSLLCSPNLILHLSLSILPARGRNLKAPGRACWCGWPSWTCSSPTSNTFQRATSITRYSSSMWGHITQMLTCRHLLYSDRTRTNCRSCYCVRKNLKQFIFISLNYLFLSLYIFLRRNYQLRPKCLTEKNISSVSSLCQLWVILKEGNSFS